MRACKRLGCDVEFEVEGKLSIAQAEHAHLKKAFEEFVERVDNALLLDEELAGAWTDLCDGVVKARRVLRSMK